MTTQNFRWLNTKSAKLSASTTCVCGVLAATLLFIGEAAAAPPEAPSRMPVPEKESVSKLIQELKQEHSTKFQWEFVQEHPIMRKEFLDLWIKNTLEGKEFLSGVRYARLELTRQMAVQVADAGPCVVALKIRHQLFDLPKRNYYYDQMADLKAIFSSTKKVENQQALFWQVKRLVVEACLDQEFEVAKSLNSEIGKLEPKPDNKDSIGPAEFKQLINETQSMVKYLERIVQTAEAAKNKANVTRDDVHSAILAFCIYSNTTAEHLVAVLKKGDATEKRIGQLMEQSSKSVEETVELSKFVLDKCGTIPADTLRNKGVFFVGELLAAKMSRANPDSERPTLLAALKRCYTLLAPATHSEFGVTILINVVDRKQEATTITSDETIHSPASQFIPIIPAVRFPYPSQYLPKHFPQSTPQFNYQNSGFFSEINQEFLTPSFKDKD